MGCRKQKPKQDPMASLIEEQLVHLRGMIYFDAEVIEGIAQASPHDKGPAFDLAEWASTGGDFEALHFADDIDREACAYAWGYLRGVAEMADLTLDQLLDEYDLSWSGERK